MKRLCRALVAVAILFASGQDVLAQKSPPSAPPHYIGAQATAVNPDGTVLAFGSSDFSVKLWDIASGKVLRSLAGHTGWITSLAFSPDGAHLASGSGDRSVKLWEVRTGREVRTLSRMPGWITSSAFSPDGTLLASASIADPVTAEKGAYTIKLWDLRTGGEVRTITDRSGMAGRVSSVAFSPEGYLFTEGEQGTVMKRWDVRTGREIDAIAGITDGAVSDEARLYIFAVGINEYKNAKLRLKYGRSDAEAFVQAVEQHGQKVFKQIVKQTIFDTQATRQNIEAAFARIAAEVRPDDVFVFYYAGHGVMSQREEQRTPEFYMALTEVTKLNGDNRMLEERGLPARLLRELSSSIKAQKQLIVLDTCHSGGALESFALQHAPEETSGQLKGKDKGITVLAAAGTWQPATEFRQLGHGVFTYALLKGLGGEADSTATPDGKITVRELEAYLTAKVPELIKHYRGKTQAPNSLIRGSDFLLGAK
ncbi:MAG: caspase family protein [Nitrospirota bacterium]